MEFQFFNASKAGVKILLEALLLLLLPQMVKAIRILSKTGSKNGHSSDVTSWVRKSAQASTSRGIQASIRRACDGSRTEASESVSCCDADVTAEWLFVVVLLLLVDDSFGDSRTRESN